jgi:hypothetical protein
MRWAVISSQETSGSAEGGGQLVCASPTDSSTPPTSPSGRPWRAGFNFLSAGGCQPGAARFELSSLLGAQLLRAPVDADGGGRPPVVMPELACLVANAGPAVATDDDRVWVKDRAVAMQLSQADDRRCLLGMAGLTACDTNNGDQRKGEQRVGGLTCLSLSVNTSHRTRRSRCSGPSDNARPG